MSHHAKDTCMSLYPLIWLVGIIATAVLLVSAPLTRFDINDDSEVTDRLVSR